MNDRLRTFELYAARAAQLSPPSFDETADLLADCRIPQRVRDNLRRSREARLAGLLDPKMGFGPFRQMIDGAICLADQTAITGTSETALFPVAQYAGFAPNQMRAGQLWSILAVGLITTASSSQGNITVTPRFGTSTGGVALGASAATALVASGTNVPWLLEYTMVIRQVGAAGLNSTVIGAGKLSAAVAAIAAATGNVVPFSSTASVSVDLSISAGIFIGITLGSASDSMKTLAVPVESIN